MAELVILHKTLAVCGFPACHSEWQTLSISYERNKFLLTRGAVLAALCRGIESRLPQLVMIATSYHNLAMHPSKGCPSSKKQSKAPL